MRSNPRKRERESDIVADQIANMASALGGFDQSMKLIVAGAGFNLKFYFNFLDVAFFIGAGMHRRSAEINFAHARSDPERHQQTSTERANERRHRIGRRAIFTRQPPSQRAILHVGVERISRGLDRDVAMMR